MSELIGQRIQKSPKVAQLIQDLVQEVQQLNAAIETVGPTRPELADHGKKAVEKTGQVRGRPLVYNYIGSGAGRGVYVELEDGSVKLDLINGIGIHLMGHSHPRVMAATVRGALSDIINQGNLQPNNEYRIFLEKITALAAKKSKLKYGWLATCGTMANETAIKLCRQKVSPARMIMGFKNAFAGRSTLMAELTDNPAYKMGLPDYNEVLRLPFYDTKDARSTEKTLSLMKEMVAKHEGNISAFVFEPMQGEGGYTAAPREFFIPLLEFCRSKKIPIMADEVQTFSRTGELFAFETLDIGAYIDVCTIAKTAQVGCTLYTEEFNPKPGLISGTFSGTTPALTAGIEILDMLVEGNYFGPKGRINEIHQRFITGLNKINDIHGPGKVSDAGGLGLMIAFTPLDGKKETVDVLLKKLFQRGLIAFNCGKDPVRIRFLVPAIIRNEDIDLAVKLVGEVLKEGV